MLRIIHVTLAMLPAAASVPTFAALDAASHLAVTFGEISASMSYDGMEALQRSSAGKWTPSFGFMHPTRTCSSGFSQLLC